MAATIGYVRTHDDCITSKMLRPAQTKISVISSNLAVRYGGRFALAIAMPSNAMFPSIAANQASFPTRDGSRAHLPVEGFPHATNAVPRFQGSRRGVSIREITIPLPQPVATTPVSSVHFPHMIRKC